MMVSAKQLPVQRAELDGLKDVIGADGFGASEIGECSGDLEDAVVGASGEVEFLHGVFEIPA